MRLVFSKIYKNFNSKFYKNTTILHFDLTIIDVQNNYYISLILEFVHEVNEHIKTSYM